MLNYEKEEELTIPEGINEKKSRMGEYGISILTKKNDVSRFIPKDRHTMEYVDNGDGSYSQSIVKKPRK